MMLSAAQVHHQILLYDVQENKTGKEDERTTTDGSYCWWDKTSWQRDKEWLQTEYNYPLINLPFLIDKRRSTADHNNNNNGSDNIMVLSQTHAIAMYIGREFQLLLGSTSQEAANCEELLCNIEDLRDIMIDFAYKSDHDTIKQDAIKLLERAKIHLDKLEQYIQQQYGNLQEEANNDVCHCFKGQLTVPDFFLWESLDQYEGLCQRFQFPNCFVGGGGVEGDAKHSTSTGYPYLKQFKDNFIKLPVNRPYAIQYGLFSCDDKTDDTNNKATPKTIIELPYNNPYARFGSTAKPTETYKRGQEAPWRNKGMIQNSYNRVIDDVQ